MEQQFCGECLPNKYCTKVKKLAKRYEWVDAQPKVNQEPIELCLVRLQKLSRRESEGK